MVGDLAQHLLGVLAVADVLELAEPAERGGHAVAQEGEGLAIAHTTWPLTDELLLGPVAVALALEYPPRAIRCTRYT